jgi:hypothetical protein
MPFTAAITGTPQFSMTWQSCLAALGNSASAEFGRLLRFQLRLRFPKYQFRRKTLVTASRQNYGAQLGLLFRSLKTDH